MDLESLIRAADPARRATIVPADGAGARRACDQLIAADRRRRRHRAPAAGLLVAGCAAAGAVVALSPGGSPVTATPAAAAVLTHAARATQNEPSLELGTGQYLYSETRTLSINYFQWGSPTASATVLQPQTVQTWVSEDGSDRTLTTYDGPQTFATPADRVNWIAAGKPPISPTTNTASGQYDTQDGPGGVQGPPDLSGLPTDSAALARLIDSGKTGLVGYEPRVVTPAFTFATAAEILATPALGSSPAVRAALYEVMANVPGIELLGTASDHSGRDGIAIAGPLGGGTGGGTGLPYGANGVRFEVVIDPTTGDLLETSEINSDPSQNSALIQNDYGNTAGQTLSWTDYLAAGIVDSTTVAPSGPTGTTGATSTTAATQ